MLGQTLLRYYLAPLLYCVRKVWRQEATVFASCLAVCSLNMHMYPMSDTRSWILKLYICKLPHVKYFGVAKIWGGKVLLKVICDHVHTVFAAERVVAAESPLRPTPPFLGCLFALRFHSVSGLCFDLEVRLFSFKIVFFWIMGSINANG